MTPAIASLLPEIAPAPATADTATGAGDAARFGAALEQAMLAAQAGLAKGSEPSAPPMLMLLLADLPAEQAGEAASDDGVVAQTPMTSLAGEVPLGEASTPTAGAAPANSVAAADARHRIAMPANASAGEATLLDGTNAHASGMQPHGHSQADAQRASGDAGAIVTAVRPHGGDEPTARQAQNEALAGDADMRGVAVPSARMNDDGAAADESGALTDDGSAKIEKTSRPRRRAAKDDAEPHVGARIDLSVADAAAAQSPAELQVLAQASSPAAQSQGEVPHDEPRETEAAPYTSTRIDGDQSARREVPSAKVLDTANAASATSHGLGAAREADEARTAIAIAQAAGLDPAAADAAAGSLPAGVRVLDLHVQAARRQHLVANGPRTSAAPRTGEEAAAALDIAAAPQAPGAEALDRLRWPTVTPLPRETAARAAATETSLPVLQAAPSADAMTKSDVPAANTATPDASASLAAGMAARLETPSRDPQRDGRSRDDAPLAAFASALPTPSTSARADAPAVPAAPATSAAAPQEPAPRPGGIERISVRLGDGEGAPTVRIAIWQGNVDAKVITSDAQLARDLGRGAHELASALESRGFDAAQVRVRGTPSANEMMGPAQLAGSAMTESRQPEQSSQQDGRRSHEERAQNWRDERPEQRQQGRQPRRPRRDEDETEA